MLARLRTGVNLYGVNLYGVNLYWYETVLVRERSLGGRKPVTGDRTALKRHPERAVTDREAVHAVLDEALVGHVGIVVDGAPVVIPMMFARLGDAVYLHGSAASRIMRALASGAEACFTVTLLDGLVLARSAFSHSMNYRSVVAFGRAEEVVDPDEKARAFDALVDRVGPGRSREARPPTDKEWRATLLVRLPLTEVSAKARTGPPVDAESDLALDVWAGVVPLHLQRGEPVADPRGEGTGR